MFMYFSLLFLFSPATVISLLRSQELVNKNNGIELPRGYHSHSVVFMKKKSFVEHHTIPPNAPTDFSLDGHFLASGTIVNRRWILTRATPVAFYPVGSYWMVSQQAIPVPLDEDSLRKHEIDLVLIHPEFEPGEQDADVALVRTSKPIEFDFETRSAELGFDDFLPLGNCKLVVWSWFYERNNSDTDIMGRGEVAFSVKDECPFLSQNFVCLSEPDSKHQPCAINSGAPLVCGGVLTGIYAGKGDGAVCDSSPPTGLAALRIDEGTTHDWLADVFDFKHPIHDEIVVRTCGADPNTTHSLLVLIVLLKYIT